MSTITTPTNFYANLEFSTQKVMITKILETPNSKEIRICLSKGQLMKEHTAPAPIVIMVLEGKINFTVDTTQFYLNKGDIINLEAKVPHSLLAIENSVIRLTLAKEDNLTRLNKL